MKTSFLNHPRRKKQIAPIRMLPTKMAMPAARPMTMSGLLFRYGSRDDFLVAGPASLQPLFPPAQDELVDLAKHPALFRGKRKFIRVGWGSSLFLPGRFFHLRLCIRSFRFLRDVCCHVQPRWEKIKEPLTAALLHGASAEIPYVIVQELCGKSYSIFSVDFWGGLWVRDARVFLFHLLRKVITKIDDRIPIVNGQKSRERPTTKLTRIGISHHSKAQTFTKPKWTNRPNIGIFQYQ
jgi:hypothetical protein